MTLGRKERRWKGDLHPPAQQLLLFEEAELEPEGRNGIKQWLRRKRPFQKGKDMSKEGGNMAIGKK